MIEEYELGRSCAMYFLLYTVNHFTLSSIRSRTVSLHVCQLSSDHFAFLCGHICASRTPAAEDEFTVNLM